MAVAWRGGRNWRFRGRGKAVADSNCDELGVMVLLVGKGLGRGGLNC